MNLAIRENSRIYIAAPANTATGGPELLHQLAHHLRTDLRVDACMFYMPSDHPHPRHEAYEKYATPFVREIEDEERNILIVPEILNAVHLLKKYRRIRTSLWWLSINNYYFSKYLAEEKARMFPMKLVNKLSRALKMSPPFDFVEEALRFYASCDLQADPIVGAVSLHLAQSHYAYQHLRDKGIEKVAYLSDYLNEEFLRTEVALSGKDDIVAYNPKKGFEFTKRLISRADNIRFIPIAGMTREEVIRTLQRAKVYIDFGHHPGKDRIPRESAILGCCIITGRNGSARFHEDVPIPEQYKFDTVQGSYANILGTIRDCFAHFEERYEDFGVYREMIRNEPARFLADMRSIFLRNGGGAAKE